MTKNSQRKCDYIGLVLSIFSSPFHCSPESLKVNARRWTSWGCPSTVFLFPATRSRSTSLIHCRPIVCAFSLDHWLTTCWTVVADNSFSVLPDSDRILSNRFCSANSAPRPAIATRHFQNCPVTSTRQHSSSDTTMATAASIRPVPDSCVIRCLESANFRARIEGLASSSEVRRFSA